MGKKKETKIEKTVNEFLQDHPKFSNEAARKFVNKYYDKGSEDKLGSKFSERIFVEWISNALEGKIDRNNLIKHFCFSLMLDGEEIKNCKKADLYIKRKDNKEVLIEFKCNIDNVEKDLFKLVFSDEKYRKILFIWEKRDHSRNKVNDECSYLKILEAFKKHRNIDYVYLPIYRDKLKTDLTDNLEEKFGELIELILG